VDKIQYHSFRRVLCRKNNKVFEAQYRRLIEEAVFRANKIVTQGYFLMQLHALELYKAHYTTPDKLGNVVDVFNALQVGYQVHQSISVCVFQQPRHKTGAKTL
jgi:hypothetical protein